ncbi:homeobox-leucine zipper protein roc3 [Phtheirospermum japonicum]|uniref:Homeobox-leucine zipper protein roc3 n=1 Tax=Phtheirospermum japonicum TaxID=374723 RepID=A0A830BTE9_9LAMI|nr:homeobox-leucine zipper protein roc3 [Phtheirospermum japonicum]
MDVDDDVIMEMNLTGLDLNQEPTDQPLHWVARYGYRSFVGVLSSFELVLECEYVVRGEIVTLAQLLFVSEDIALSLLYVIILLFWINLKLRAYLDLYLSMPMKKHLRESSIVIVFTFSLVDNAVRVCLRWLGEPITLFGEREMERRDRLRMLMANLDSEGQLEKLMKAHEDEEAAATVLLEAPREIVRYLLVRSARRLGRVKKKRDDLDEDLDAEVDWSLKQVTNLGLECSEIGDDRPLLGCSISYGGKMLATWNKLGEYMSVDGKILNERPLITDCSNFMPDQNSQFPGTTNSLMIMEEEKPLAMDRAMSSIDEYEVINLEEYARMFSYWQKHFKWCILKLTLNMQLDLFI